MSEGHAETPPPPLLPAGVHVAHLLDVPLLGRSEAPGDAGDDDAETPPTLPFAVSSASAAAPSASHPAAPRLQKFSSFAESARAPVLEVSDEEELDVESARVTTPPREGGADKEVFLHALRVENEGTLLRDSLLAPPVSPPCDGRNDSSR